MREIADEVGATLMVDMAHFAGLVAGKVFTGDEDPVPHAHVVTTTTHGRCAAPRRAGAGHRSTLDAVDKGCPMVLGGPLSHVMAAKAVASPKRASPPSRPTTRRGWPDNAQAFADGLMRRGATLVTGHRQPHRVAR